MCLIIHQTQYDKAADDWLSIHKTQTPTLIIIPAIIFLFNLKKNKIDNAIEWIWNEIISLEVHWLDPNIKVSIWYPLPF